MSLKNTSPLTPVKSGGVNESRQNLNHTYGPACLWLPAHGPTHSKGRRMDGMDKRQRHSCRDRYRVFLALKKPARFPWGCWGCWPSSRSRPASSPMPEIALPPSPPCPWGVVGMDGQAGQQAADGSVGCVRTPDIAHTAVCRVHGGCCWAWSQPGQWEHSEHWGLLQLTLKSSQALPFCTCIQATSGANQLL